MLAKQPLVNGRVIAKSAIQNNEGDYANILKLQKPTYLATWRSKT